jgi:hypothetical protein
VVAAPPDVKNALQLMQWLRDKRYIPKGGNPAQLVVVKLFKEINSVAHKSLEDIKKRMKAIRDDTYDAWDFNAILGVPGDSTAKKIESAGTKNG